MFGIKKIIHKWTLKRMGNELRYFIDTLKNMTPDEVSFVVMTATVVRNTFIKDMNLDFGNPVEAQAQSPFISLHLAKLINDCKRKNTIIDRTAYIVWAHTLRVASQPELAPLGKELWNELERGIDYLNNNPELVEKCTTENANPTGYQLIPLS